MMSELNEKTPVTLSKKHGVSTRQIERDARFSEAIESIEKNVGKEAVNDHEVLLSATARRTRRRLGQQIRRVQDHKTLFEE